MRQLSSITIQIFLNTENVMIKMHVFGHIHGDRGYKYWEGRTYVNASSVNEQYYLFSSPITRVVKAADGEYYVEES